MLVAHTSEEHSIDTCILCPSLSFPSRQSYASHLSRSELYRVSHIFESEVGLFSGDGLMG
jgi:hypothetical protein